MTFPSLVLKSRSIRRFGPEPMERGTLLQLVDIARSCPSGSNKQPLKYLLSADPARNALIFPCLAWAGQIKDWPGPAEGERPAGYIIVLGDTTVAADFGVDHGLAAQTIMLAAADKGLGGCILGAVQRERLAATLGIGPRYRILLVLALGTPGEKVVLEDLPAGSHHRYWRDAAGVHHVPKRLLRDVVVEG
jgi:nitroreductase